MSMVDASDTQLIQDALAGSAAAWEGLVARFARLVYAIALRAGLTKEEAGRATRASFETLQQHLREVAEEASPRQWLLATAQSECARLRRERMPSQEGESPVVSPEVIATLEKQHLIRQALATLSERCQSLLRALYYERGKLSDADIARRQGLAEGGAAIIRARCLRYLHHALERFDLQLTAGGPVVDRMLPDQESKS